MSNVKCTIQIVLTQKKTLPKFSPEDMKQNTHTYTYKYKEVGFC